MNLFFDAIAYILDAGNLFGAKGIVPRVLDHLGYTGISMLVAMLIAVPLGLLIGHTGRGRNLVVLSTSSFRALPTFGLLLFIILQTGLGLVPLVTVLVILAVPPLLAGTYSAIDAVPRPTIDAARGTGMTEWQILTRVELPIGMPLILGGVRTAALQVIATATIAGYVGLTGLGRFIIEGLAERDYTRGLVGAILVAILAIVVDGILALVQHHAVPRGVSHGMARTTRGRPPGPVAQAVAPVRKG